MHSATMILRYIFYFFLGILLSPFVSPLGALAIIVGLAIWQGLRDLEKLAEGRNSGQCDHRDE